MAIRARADNLSLDCPEQDGVAAPLVEFAEVWAHREVLRQSCMRLTGDAARAEDLVHDTFVSALKSGDRLDRRTSIGPWLATVARRRSIDEIRGRQRLALVATTPEPPQAYADDPADHVLNQELVAQLRAAVETLTDRERQLLLRQATYGMSLAELAAEEQTSVASVRSVLARARQKLRVTLERNGALGVLPLPRVFVSLREKFNRWAVQLESSMPTLAGASAHMSNVVVAMVAAIATMLGGGPPLGGDSVVMIGHGDQHVQLPSADEAPTRASVAGRAGAPSSNADESVPPSSPSAPGAGHSVPGVKDVTLPTLPQDSNSEITNVGVLTLSQSDDGAYVFATGNNDSSDDTIFRSSDGGVTWTRLQATGFTGGSILAPPTYPAKPTLFALDSEMLWRSDDGGNYFFPAAPARGAVFAPGYATGDERLLLGGSPLLEYSVATRLTSPLTGTSTLPRPRTMVATDSLARDGAVLVSAKTRTSPTTEVGAVYRCTAAGCQPPALLPNMPGSPSLRRLADGTIAAWDGRRVYLSDDDGASFYQVTTPVALGIMTIAEGPGSDLLLGASGRPVGSNFFRSGDRGVTWTAIGLGTGLSRGVEDLLRLPNGSIIGAPTWTAGVQCSTDDAASWQSHC